MFFGTWEVAWIGAEDVTAWDSGMAQSSCAKGRKNKRFGAVLERLIERMFSKSQHCSQRVCCSARTRRVRLYMAAGVLSRAR
jgi:hypothetical protein